MGDAVVLGFFRRSAIAFSNSFRPSSGTNPARLWSSAGSVSESSAFWTSALAASSFFCAFNALTFAVSALRRTDGSVGNFASASSARARTVSGSFIGIEANISRFE